MLLLKVLQVKVDNIVIPQQVLQFYVGLIINMVDYARIQILLALPHTMLNHIVTSCANILNMVVLLLLEILFIQLQVDALMLVLVQDASKLRVQLVEYK